MAPINQEAHSCNRICSLHFVGWVKSGVSSVPNILPWSLSEKLPPKKWCQLIPPPKKQPKLEDQLFEALDEAQQEINARDARTEELENEVVGCLLWNDFQTVILIYYFKPAN